MLTPYLLDINSKISPVVVDLLQKLGLSDVVNSSADFIVSVIDMGIVALTLTIPIAVFFFAIKLIWRFCRGDFNA